MIYPARSSQYNARLTSPPAEKLFADGSYAKAREAYQAADADSLTPTERRWLDFRLADTLWRAQAASNTRDSTPFDQAQKQLNVLIRDIDRAEALLPTVEFFTPS